jgi:anti-anti-sigma factor
VREGDVLIDHLLVSSGFPPTIDADDPAFGLCVESASGCRVVRVSGELDIAARDLVRRACLEGSDLTVVVDMTELTFIDCCGYGALIAASRILTDLGGSLTMHNQTGQPAFLLGLLHDLETDQPHLQPPGS